MGTSAFVRKIYTNVKIDQRPKKTWNFGSISLSWGGTCTAKKAQEEIWAFTLGTLWVSLSWMA